MELFRFSGLPGGGKRARDSQAVHLKAIKVAELQSRFDVSRSKVVEIGCKDDLLARCQLQVQTMKTDKEFFEKIIAHKENDEEVLQEVQKVRVTRGNTDGNINNLGMKLIPELREIDGVIQRLSTLKETMVSAWSLSYAEKFFDEQKGTYNHELMLTMLADHLKDKEAEQRVLKRMALAGAMVDG